MGSEKPSKRLVPLRTMDHHGDFFAMTMRILDEQHDRLDALESRTAGEQGKGLCYPFSTKTCDDPKCPCRDEKRASPTTPPAASVGESLWAVIARTTSEKMIGREGELLRGPDELYNCFVIPPESVPHAKWAFEKWLRFAINSAVAEARPTHAQIREAAIKHYDTQVVHQSRDGYVDWLCDFALALIDGKGK